MARRNLNPAGKGLGTWPYDRGDFRFEMVPCRLSRYSSLLPDTVDTLL